MTDTGNITAFSVPTPRAWGPKEAAAFLRISERHLRDIRREDSTFPPPRMVGNKPRWSPDAVPQWVASGGSIAAIPAPRHGRKAQGGGRVE